jgi:pimeloyl-ACP methyl ester carboxylesterase
MYIRMEHVFFAVFIVSALLAAAWLLFSFAAGCIVYLSSLTTDHAELEPKKMVAAEGGSALQAHTKDPVVMDPLNAAKERWYKLRDAHAFDELTLRSKDGLTLAGFYWKGTSGEDRTVLIVHGMLDSAAGMGYLAEEYHHAGWNVLSVDQRSHGESEGTTRTMGVREADDIGLWVDELERRYGASRIVVHGVSMGGAAVLLYAGRKRGIPLSVYGVVSDASYATYQEVFYLLLRKALPGDFIAWSILRGASVASFVHSGVRFGRMSPARCIRRIPARLVLFHGQKDLLVPISTVRDMFCVAKECDSEIVVVPEAPHIGAYFYAPELYMGKLFEFFK